MLVAKDLCEIHRQNIEKWNASNYELEQSFLRHKTCGQYSSR